MDRGSLSLSRGDRSEQRRQGRPRGGRRPAGGGIAVNSTWVNGVLVSTAALTAQDSTLSGNQALGTHNTSGYGGQA